MMIQENKIKDKKIKKLSNIVSKKSEEINVSNLTSKPDDITCLRNVWGWQDSVKCAESIWSSIHSKLLEGDLVFAYRNVGINSDLCQFVVVKNNKIGNNDFAVGVITSGYTMLLPHVPIDYVETDLVEDLRKWKLEKSILNTYEQIIKGIKDEITSD